MAQLYSEWNLYVGFKITGWAQQGGGCLFSSLVMAHADIHNTACSGAV